MSSNFKYKIIKKGCTRIVFIIGNYVIKIPNFEHSMQHFLYGCYANWSERVISKQVSKTINHPFTNKIAPCLFCCYFGLIFFFNRCIEKINDLTIDEINDYKDIHQGDSKKENFGYLNGKLVCLDYP